MFKDVGLFSPVQFQQRVISSSYLVSNVPTPQHPSVLGASAKYNPICLAQTLRYLSITEPSGCSFGQGDLGVTVSPRCLLAVFISQRSFLAAIWRPFLYIQIPGSVFSRTFHSTGPWDHVHSTCTQLIRVLALPQGSFKHWVYFSSTQVGILPIKEDHIKA